MFNQSHRFADRVVVVTGASSGIGKALGLNLVDQRAKVVLAARNVERLNALAAECRRRGGEAIAVPTDVVDEPRRQALTEHTPSRYLLALYAQFQKVITRHARDLATHVLAPGKMKLTGCMFFDESIEI